MSCHSSNVINICIRSISIKWREQYLLTVLHAPFGTWLPLNKLAIYIAPINSALIIIMMMMMIMINRLNSRYTYLLLPCRIYSRVYADNIYIYIYNNIIQQYIIQLIIEYISTWCTQWSENNTPSQCWLLAQQILWSINMFILPYVWDSKGYEIQKHCFLINANF